MPTVISSSANPQIKAFRRMMRKGELDRQRRIPLEGIRLIRDAVDSGLAIETLYVAESRVQDKAIQGLIALRENSDWVLVKDPVFTRMIETESPQGVAALVRLPGFSWEEISAVSPLVLVAWEVQDPGNLGTLIRSAGAFGAGAVLLVKSTVSPYNQKVVRASAGSIFRVPCFQWGDPGSLMKELRQRGFRLITTSSHYGTDFQKVDYSGSSALFIGNEGKGLPHHLVQSADFQVRIPQANIESLNAAVAASIILAESWRQRCL